MSIQSLFESLRTWPGVGRASLSLLLPAVDGEVAVVLDGRCARGLRALGYAIVRPDGVGMPTQTPRLMAVAPPPGSDWMAVVARYAQALPRGAQLLVRAPLGSRERLAAAFLHASLQGVAQLPLGRSVLTTGLVR